MSLYAWLDDWGKTPADLGVPLDRVDPKYFDAMMFLRGEYADLHNQQTERRKRAGQSRSGPNYPGL